MTATTAENPKRDPIVRELSLIFVLSGFAALVYQVLWQRSLFALYGISVEAVTVVVTAFMIGLGLGSFVGGMLSRRTDRRALRWFAGIETAIGLFGALSIPLFRAVGSWTLHWPSAWTAVLTLALLLIPTMLMGSTLPLLVSHVVRRHRNVGSAVGTLYFVNTLGSALAALASGLLLLHLMGQLACTWLAALLNLTVAVRALRLEAREQRRDSPAT